jgi:hypothetical protein
VTAPSEICFKNTARQMTVPKLRKLKIGFWNRLADESKKVYKIIVDYQPVVINDEY